MDLTKDKVIEAERRLSGGARTGDTDSVSLQHYIIQFGEASGDLRLIVTYFAEWLVNECPPWATYCLLMSG